MMAVNIREMLAIDAVEVSALLPDLGYAANPGQIAQRFSQLMTRPDNVCFVALYEDKIVGWLHAHGVRLLESDGYVDIGGLVVAAQYQRNGCGRRLIRAAEQWAGNHGYSRVRLRSGVHREDAHVFYEALGYKKSKASYAFETHVETQC
ncbi:GNAT family N-acetyltransferase [Glaciimonas soli]|uniref:GNAT family N-acetyltransferase n=1 Tax=Glaciimonas soli TaxID=2590999 RepID=A0A843YQ03_9BURK|nr:GNAT family N-acetyltransferase [Glaciimonas soli]MQR01869.1 GNAT family N-acetyltransferase [Glaciimonas soli]